MPRVLDLTPALETSGRRHVAPVLMAAVLALVALGFATATVAAIIPPARWLSALLSPDPDSMADLVFHYAVLPRMAGSLVAGAALGLAGALFQQALRNPFAVPDTLGVEAGAQLALAAVTLWAPAILGFGRTPIAFAGGCVAVAAALALGWRRGLSPLVVILSGLVVTLYASALGTMLLLLHAHDLSGLLIWAGGSLNLQDWTPVTTLTAGVMVIVIPILLLLRPLALLALDDAAVRAIGAPVAAIRVAALVAGVALTALVTGTFGSIGFISLAAPVLARSGGVRRLGPAFAWSAALGGLLLWLTDGAVEQVSSYIGTDLPTGSATALFGTPLLVWLLGRHQAGEVVTSRATDSVSRRRARHLLPLLALGLLVLLGLALSVGRGFEGWSVDVGHDLALLLPWRWPRTVAAAAAGALLAVSGLILQRVSGNPMASPEMLGLSAGAGFGLFMALVFEAAPSGQTLAGIAGACVTGVVLLAWTAWRGFAPTRLLVVGLAVTTSATALISGFGATGDPRALRLMAWLAGSTSQVTEVGALATTLAVVLAVPLVALALRALDLLSLGATASQGLGLPASLARFVLCVLAAGLAGAGTLIVGPLSFVGLIAPHLAWRAGLHRALPQVAGTALTGAALMILADWIGRVANVPWQIPSGLVAALIGAPLLALLLG